MVIALLFVSLLSGLLGVTCAVWTEGGLLMGIGGYMAGGMIGSAGFIVFAAIRCAPVPVHVAEHTTRVAQTNG